MKEKVAASTVQGKAYLLIVNALERTKHHIHQYSSGATCILQS